MKPRPTAVFILFLTVLVNNILLSSVLWIDQCRAVTGMADAIMQDDTHGGNAHHDSATHCCHLQAHFQTILTQSGLLADAHRRNVWMFQSITQLYSLAFSPPIPPPKKA